MIPLNKPRSVRFIEEKTSMALGRVHTSADIKLTSSVSSYILNRRQLLHHILNSPELLQPSTWTTEQLCFEGMMGFN